MTFDTLSYARRLKDAGLPEAQAEAIADGTRELVFQDVATKRDLGEVRNELKADFAAVRQEIGNLRTDLKAEIAALDQRLQTQGLQITVRLGGLIAVGIAILAAIMKL